MTGTATLSLTKLPQLTMVGALGLVAGCLAAAPAAALPIVTTYDLSSTEVDDCGSGTAPHGLWTSSLNPGGGACDNLFDFQPGSYLQITADGATVTGTVYATGVNPSGYLATINLVLGGFQETSSGLTVKTDGWPSPGYNTGTDTPDVDFFKTVTGTVVISQPDHTSYGTYIINGPKSPTAFQYGTQAAGANDKDGHLGASAWLLVSADSGTTGEAANVGDHWDVNANSVQVPEPSILALLGVGLIGISAVTRKRRVSDASGAILQ